MAEEVLQNIQDRAPRVDLDGNSLIAFNDALRKMTKDKRDAVARNIHAAVKRAAPDGQIGKLPVLKRGEGYVVYNAEFTDAKGQEALKPLAGGGVIEWKENGNRIIIVVHDGKGASSMNLMNLI